MTLKIENKTKRRIKTTLGSSQYTEYGEVSIFLNNEFVSDCASDKRNLKIIIVDEADKK